jgi:hypothetical protein
MERLSSRIEHLKSQNEVLTLTLTESKNHCDNLTVLIGKYESNYSGYSLSEALFLASIDPKYDNRLFIELRAQYEKLQVQYMLCTSNCSECQNKKQFDVHKI